jgi:hypothetical protein
LALGAELQCPTLVFFVCNRQGVAHVEDSGT